MSVSPYAPAQPIATREFSYCPAVTVAAARWRRAISNFPVVGETHSPARGRKGGKVVLTLLMPRSITESTYDCLRSCGTFVGDEPRMVADRPQRPNTVVFAISCSASPPDLQLLKATIGFLRWERGTLAPGHSITFVASDQLDTRRNAMRPYGNFSDEDDDQAAAAA